MRDTGHRSDTGHRLAILDWLPRYDRAQLV